MSCLSVHDLDDPWFHATCSRCGTFVERDGLCEPCAVVADHAVRTREAHGVAWKLALGPALVVLATLSMLAHHRDVPPVFAVWLVPLTCAYAVARTERAGWAWLGAVTSIGVLLWLTAAVTYADQQSRLIDVLMLSIAPLVALPGCVRLSRVAERLRLCVSAPPQ